MIPMRSSLLAALCALSVLAPNMVTASDESDVAATVRRWIRDFNLGDMNSFLAACAPSAAVVDGFPPYAWITCSDWMADYRENSKAIELTDGRLSVGKPIVSWVTGDRAYVIYPAKFSDQEKGKPVIYRGTWTITLQKTSGRWLFTGSASAWTH